MPETKDVPLLIAGVYIFWAVACRLVVSYPRQFLYRLNYFDRTAEPGHRTLNRTRIIAVIGHAVLVFLALGTLIGTWLPARWTANGITLPVQVTATILVLCVTLQGTGKALRGEGHKR
jgi:hypothetical protein